LREELLSPVVAVEDGDGELRVVRDTENDELERVEEEGLGNDEIVVLVLREDALHSALDDGRDGFVDLTVKTEEERFGELRRDDAVLSSELAARHAGVENLEVEAAVVGVCREEFGAVVDAVVEEACEKGTISDERERRKGSTHQTSRGGSPALRS
jgi:hypothetical protein